jgi:hypothetical protein
MFIRLSKLVPELGVSRRVAYHWAKQGLLPGAFQMNGTWLVDLDVFNAWKGEATKWSAPTKHHNNLVSSRKPPSGERMPVLYYCSPPRAAPSWPRWRSGG